MHSKENQLNQIRELFPELRELITHKHVTTLATEERGFWNHWFYKGEAAQSLTAVSASMKDEDASWGDRSGWVTKQGALVLNSSRVGGSLLVAEEDGQLLLQLTSYTNENPSLTLTNTLSEGLESADEAQLEAVCREVEELIPTLRAFISFINGDWKEKTQDAQNNQL